MIDVSHIDFVGRLPKKASPLFGAAVIVLTFTSPVTAQHDYEDLKTTKQLHDGGQNRMYDGLTIRHNSLMRGFTNYLGSTYALSTVLPSAFHNKHTESHFSTCYTMWPSLEQDQLDCL